MIDVGCTNTDECWECDEELQDICVDYGEECDEDSEDCKVCDEDAESCRTCDWVLKDICVAPANKCGNGVVDEWETCENCSKDFKWDTCQDIWWEIPDNPDNPNPSVPTDDLCGNGVEDNGETCATCPEDLWWCIQNKNCNTCPCEYADIASQLTRWDKLRAKLFDKKRSVFYKYSPIVSIDHLFKDPLY